jgi:hypothetical protein
VTLDIGALRTLFVDAAVVTVNYSADKTADRAREKAPVRKIFAGGRQTVRFKTAAEIDADRGLRARLGLGPEIAATPANRAAIGRKFRNPGTGKVETLTEKSFARTVEHEGRTHSVHRDVNGQHTDTSHTDHSRNTRNRANSFRNSQEDRLLDTLTIGREGRRNNLQPRLLSDSAEARLTARGRYELRSGRAFAARLKAISIDTETGKLKRHFAKGSERLGGTLRGTIHVEYASAEQYPVIKASVVAGGEDAPYAIQQELGNRHNPAHPFLRPALAVAKDELPGDLKRGVTRIVGGSRR